MNRLLVFVFAFALLPPAGVRADSGAAPLWRGLEPGPHAIGFRMTAETDTSRPPIGGSGGGAGPVRDGTGRAMPIAIWYPARTTPTGTTIRFGDYVEALAPEPFAGPAAARRLAGRSVFAETAAELGGDAKALDPEMPRLEALATPARRDAPPAEGRFPLVLFPAWRSPADQSVMAEYLASRGFVVAATGLRGTADADPEIGVAGIETFVADLRFLLSAARALPFVDGRRYGVMGVGIVASGALALEMRDPEVGALVSLDGGIPTAFEDRILRKTPFWDPWTVCAPMLAIWAPHESIEPAYFDQYRYARREIVHFPKMSEFYFLSYGALEAFAPTIVGKPPGDVGEGFRWACRLVGEFFARTLAGETRPIGRPPEGVFRTETREALPAPATLGELKHVFREQGTAGVSALYRERRHRDPQPVSPRVLTTFTTWLGWGRDPDWSARLELARLRVESFPKSARAHFALAQAAAGRSEKALAAAEFEATRALLEQDDDPELEPATRRLIDTAAKKGIDAARGAGSGAKTGSR